MEKGKLDVAKNMLKSKMPIEQIISLTGLKGLGHAIHCAKDDIVHNPTKPCLEQLIDAYDDCGGGILGVQEVLPQDVSKYGIVDGS